MPFFTVTLHVVTDTDIVAQSITDKYTQEFRVLHTSKTKLR